MYLTIKETAEYLSMREDVLQKLVLQGKIRTVTDADGKTVLINKDQFATHLKQVEKIKQQIAEYMSEPLPEDPDINDED